MITGTGVSLPPNVVTNDDLSLIMDTSDEWITTRTGVRERRFVDPGTGTSDLAIEACRAALEDAGVEVDAIDLLVTATMTPDYFAPGIAGQVQAGLGLPDIAAIDIRQQCSGFLYGLDVADAFLRSGKARTAVIVGAEVHAGFLPWSESSWRAVLGDSDASVSEAEREVNTTYRAWSVLFGDGAGAVVLTADDRPGQGILDSVLGTDGASFELIWVPGIGFRHRPYAGSAQLKDDAHLPVMDGGGLYRKAVRLMPQAVREVVDRTGMTLEDIDVVVAHQANDRILDGVVRQLGADPEKVPSNIAELGNTTAGTLPILYHQLRESGRIVPGSLVCFTAFGAGAHYGAVLYREPEAAR